MAKKYYWLRLQKDFFHRHDIRIIEAMPNGKDYILFYLKLLVESVSHEGELRFSEAIPYSDTMLATVTETNVDIVRQALKIFTQLEMIEMLDDQTIFMTEVEKMIGSADQDEHTRESTRNRVRAFRERKKLDQLEDAKRYSNVTCNGEIELEKEIEKEIEIEPELESETKKKRKAPVVYFDDERLDSTFKDFIDMRKKIRSPMTDKAITLAIKKVTDLATVEGYFDVNLAVDIIDQSIMNSWKGLFPLKEDNSKQHNESTVNENQVSNKWLEALKEVTGGNQ